MGRLLFPYVVPPSFHPGSLSPVAVAHSVAHRAFPLLPLPPSLLAISTCGGLLSSSQSLFSTRFLLYMLSLTTLMKSDGGWTNARLSLSAQAQALLQTLRNRVRLGGPDRRPLSLRRLSHRTHPIRPRLHPLLPKACRPLLPRRLPGFRRRILTLPAQRPLCLPREFVSLHITRSLSSVGV